MCFEFYLVPLAFFCLFEGYAVVLLWHNRIKKQSKSLTLAPAFYFFLVFLWFGVIDDNFGVGRAVLYLIGLIAVNIILLISNAKYYPKDFDDVKN